MIKKMISKLFNRNVSKLANKALTKNKKMKDLNHPKVKKFTKEIASSLELELSFIDFVFAKNHPECFSNWIEDVEGSWTCYIPEDFEVAYPLWSTNADQTLIMIKNNQLYFSKGWHDCADMEMISRTTQGLLTDLLIKILDADVSKEEVKQGALFCGYRYLDELLYYFNQPEDPNKDFYKERRRFISMIDEKPK